MKSEVPLSGMQQHSLFSNTYFSVVPVVTAIDTLTCAFVANIMSTTLSPITAVFAAALLNCFIAICAISGEALS